MKEFRVARCLENGEVNEYAIFKGGIPKKRIFYKEGFGKYFCVDNELNTDCTIPLRFSFKGRIKDAIDTIRNGNGDAILSSSSCNNILGGGDRVVYFLDREIGEKLRAKTIEGWKDAEFGWVMTAGNKNSLVGYFKIDEDGSMPLAHDNLKIFDTKEDAEKCIQDLIKKAFEFAKRMSNITNSDFSEEVKSESYNAVLCEVKEVGKANIIINFMYDMLNDYLILKSDKPKLFDYGYKICQWVCDERM